MSGGSRAGPLSTSPESHPSQLQSPGQLACILQASALTVSPQGRQEGGSRGRPVLRDSLSTAWRDVGMLVLRAGEGEHSFNHLITRDQRVLITSCCVIGSLLSAGDTESVQKRNGV